MVNLGKTTMHVNIKGTTNEVVSAFLRVFLANQRLTEKQLSVTTELVSKYAEYNSNGVKEPYASQLLFSTESRREICSELEISPAHLNNTFNALTSKNIVAKEGMKYVMNPEIIPTQKLTFNFTIEDGTQRSNREKDSKGAGIKPASSGKDIKEPVLDSKEDDSIQTETQIDLHLEAGVVHEQGDDKGLSGNILPKETSEEGKPITEAEKRRRSVGI